MKKNVCASLMLLALAACGGSSDPGAYKATTAGPGSSVASAETAAAQGTIRYAQYQATNTVMSDKGYAVPSLSAAVNFDPASKKGSIQFPVAAGTELVSTSDAYATVSWAGPLSSGAYRFNGNLLMGCNASASTTNEVTQVFASSSLERVQNGSVDDLSGTTFDVFDCALLAQSKVETLKINTDGTLYMSITNSTLPKNQAFDLLNPERYPGILIANANGRGSGAYSGQAFRYGVNGVTRYAIVLQSSVGSDGIAPYRFHYFLAVQR
ncbi:hypothetical protein KTQ42_00335|uniref:hypothetical protein n=1 Tax=Noviherbaspirillum sp. L7-7A TaxID=2850560 RepID=UPI001C2C7688|nr:hypothetical protein [Noviherbaspirillum sp. L7-7A]MBV0877751.1 hypothetical protein [Noviherbaspirillum sp. L7-7A]